MNPNLRSGEFILVNLWTKDFTPGDVVVFNVGQVKETFIKRIIAGEGNTVYVDNYRVYLNGAASEATSYQVQWDLNDLFCKYSEIYTLKENEFFMMGDNRCSSSDSRSFGPVSKDKILGKVITSLRF